MDSKLKALTISCMAFLIIFVLLLVVYVNRSRTGGRNKPLKEQEQTQSLEGGSAQKQTFEGTQIGNDLSSFLNDEEFFDKEKSKYEQYLEQKNTLSMILTSIEKDLRIKIVNFDGDVVSGESFTVEVAGKGEYTDTDQDGIIYIPYLKSGDYMVSLKKLEGYTVPENAARVNVKDQVEYAAIEDISMLIKTEDEINPELDDTEKKDVSQDTDKTEVRKLRAPAGNANIGIDVSKWNKDIDWEKVKEAGVEFVIIRCGYRGSVTGSLVIDPYFEQNIHGAQEAGLNVGVYFFTQAVNEVEAVEEASMVLNLIQNQYLTYPVFIDTEGAGGGRADALSVEKRTAVCKAFCDTIQNAGYSSGVYASKNWYNNRLHAEELERYAIWMAEYRETPTYEGYYNMWQYTSKGKVDGIEGNVDLDISYIDIYAGQNSE